MSTMGPLSARRVRRPRTANRGQTLTHRMCKIFVGITLSMWLLGLLIYIASPGDGSTKENQDPSFSTNSNPLSRDGGADAKAVNKVVFDKAANPSPIITTAKVNPEPLQSVRDRIKKHIGIQGHVDLPEIEHIDQEPKRQIDIHHADGDDPDDFETPRHSPVFDLSYPKNWRNNCFPSRAYDRECITNHLKYWKKGTSNIEQAPPIYDKYVTFFKDPGGWNNIRQAFEFHVMVAWVTQRTLVLPPDTAWYLIDNSPGGDIVPDDDRQFAWPHDASRRVGVSNFDIWFDLDDLHLAIPVITAPEFIQREYENRNLGIPQDFEGGFIVNEFSDIGNQWMEWLNGKATELEVNLPWGQLDNFLYWPSREAVEKENGEMIDNLWIDNRIGKEYTKHLHEALFIHFQAPNGWAAGPSDGMSYRYLGQIARSIAFDSPAMDRQFKQILRDHVHLKGDIMEYAAMVVSILGAFQYSSLHIRRNELQYKYVWCSGADSYENIRPLIDDKEPLYIATDETKAGFFRSFEDRGQRQVYQWHDFFGPDALFEETADVRVPAKLVGEVEMVICAMGRVFFGTKESTFSDYIGRLRGYLDAPYTQTLYHHYALTSDIEESSRISLSNPAKLYVGKTYKIPFPELWEDIWDLP